MRVLIDWRRYIQKTEASNRSKRLTCYSTEWTFFQGVIYSLFWANLEYKQLLNGTSELGQNRLILFRRPFRVV